MKIKSFKYFEENTNESSLSRIWRHTMLHECGAISGYRDDNSRSQNNKNNSEIKAFLRSRGYGVTAIQGNYIENFKTDAAIEVREPSFFVVDSKDTGKLHTDLMALGEKYDQDSVLVVLKDGKNAELVGTSKRDNAYPLYRERIKLGDAKYGKVTGQFLSRVNNREFTFESTVDPKTRNGKWAASIIAKQVEVDLTERGWKAE